MDVAKWREKIDGLKPEERKKLFDAVVSHGEFSAVMENIFGERVKGFESQISELREQIKASKVSSPKDETDFFEF